MLNVDGLHVDIHVSTRGLTFGFNFEHLASSQSLVRGDSILLAIIPIIDDTLIRSSRVDKVTALFTQVAVAG